ncbi:MAG: hypothetical protein CVV46_05995 [Spirochaetae bacterium HGW-Spirochaetae-2]|nr:MAG: hypothetical protein CVV46_05995 [Spirochaetae bacterium HGW-Spirochaetae-2]
MRNNTIVLDRSAFERMVFAATAYQTAVNEVLATITTEQPSKKDEWINTKEAQQITGISKEKLSRMARLGECEARRVGSDWRFPRSKVEDMSFIHVNNTAESR